MATDAAISRAPMSLRGGRLQATDEVPRSENPRAPHGTISTVDALYDLNNIRALNEHNDHNVFCE